MLKPVLLIIKMNKHAVVYCMLEYYPTVKNKE